MIKKSLQGYKRVVKEGFLDLLYGLVMKGIESFLILYLTSSLFFKDQEAFELLGTKSVIYYCMAFLMAFMTQKLFSVKGSVFTGLIYMAFGTFLLAQKGMFFLAVGIGFLTAGYSLGRPAIFLMLSEKDKITPETKEKDTRHLYAFGNIASVIGPIILALIGHYTDWKTVFYALSLICCVATAALYASFPKKQPFFSSKAPQQILKSLGIALGAPLALSTVVYHQNLKWFLTLGTALGAIFVLKKNYQQATQHTRLILQKLFILGPTIIVFFTLQSQEFFLMPLYIERFVIKDWGWMTLQTPWFHSINPIVALLFTPFLTKTIKNQRKKGKKRGLNIYILGAFLLLFIKFFLVALSTHFPVWGVFLIIIGYIGTGVSIILLVPTAYQFIVKVRDKTFQRVLIGSLYLMMVFAYLGTTFMSHLVTDPNIKHTLLDYREIFYGFTGASGMLLIGFFFFFRFSKRKANPS